MPLFGISYAGLMHYPFTSVLSFRDSSFSLMINFAIGCLLVHLVVPSRKREKVALAIRLRYENETSGIGVEELERLFKSNFPRKWPVRYHDFEGGCGPTWFYFSGDNAETIQAEVKRVLGERPLPADAHFVIRTDWTTNEERQVPLAA